MRLARFKLVLKASHRSSFIYLKGIFEWFLTSLNEWFPSARIMNLFVKNMFENLQLKTILFYYVNMYHNCLEECLDLRIVQGTL